MSSYQTLKALQIWKDHPVYIVAGGPSILSQNLELIKNKIVVGVNNSYQMGNWIDCCWFGDTRWYHWWWNDQDKPLKVFPNLIATCAPQPDQFNKRVIYFERDFKKRHGISPDPNKVAWNMNSGFSCIDFCIKMGASAVILLGMDMGLIPNNNTTHWHGGHKKSGYKPKPSTLPYKRFLTVAPSIKIDADARNIPIINTSLQSQIGHFPKISLEEVVKIY